MDYNWTLPYKCHHVGCDRRFMTMVGVIKHSKKMHSVVIPRRPPGNKKIYTIAAFRTCN